MLNKITNYGKSLYNSSFEAIGNLGKRMVETGSVAVRRSTPYIVQGELAPQKLTETLKNKLNDVNGLKNKKFKLERPEKPVEKRKIEPLPLLVQSVLKNVGLPADINDLADMNTNRVLLALENSKLKKYPTLLEDISFKLLCKIEDALPREKEECIELYYFLKDQGKLPWRANIDKKSVSIKELKEEVFQKFTELVLMKRELTSLPEGIGKLVNLTNLDLFVNNLTRLPESFGNLIQLTTLDLRSNKLKSLPESIGKLINLTELDLHSNKLTSLPDSIGNLVNLTTLDLWGNKLRSLPESFGKLIQLTTLSLRSNKLKSLPDSIGNLVNLTTLDLSSNKLTSLPENVGNLVKLIWLNLYNNPGS